jgi:hypothetical protein
VAGTLIASLPAAVEETMLPMIMDDPAPGPYFDVGDGTRVRRTPAFVHLEWQAQSGEWCNWYVPLDDDPQLRTRGGFVHMHQTMVMSRALALRARGSAAANLVEQAAPNATALARHQQARVGGVQTAVLHIPYVHYDGQQATNLGLTLDEAAIQTLLIVVYPSPLGERVDLDWGQRSAVALETAWTIFQEVSALEDEIARHGPGAHRRLLASPTGNWVDRVGGAVDVVNSAGEILGAVAKIAKAMAGP